ncbi:MAG: 3-hexulose-6-phosphate isomerase [bacterium ADurb.Bin429]|nr:MAG: 3-hexulose-6-phosphate isomerase [bacterium ADurb.Bin429]
MGFKVYSRTLVEEVGDVLCRVEPAEVERLVWAIINTRRLFLVGRGRSGHMMNAFAIRLTHLDIHCHVVGESTTPGLQPDDLLLVGSGSGETVTAVLTANAAHAAGGKVAVLTSRRESTLGRLADLRVVIPAPVREQSVDEPVTTIQPMGSLFEQSLLLLLDTIVLMLKDRLRQDDATMMARHSNLE